MKNNFLKIFVIVLILFGGGWYAYHTYAAKHAAPAGAGIAAQKMGPMPVGAVPAEAKDMPVTINAVGTLTASESAEIKAEIAGVVKAVNFSEAGAVKKDDSLVEIDDSIVKAELMKATATYNMRRTTFGRSDKLKSSGYVSSQDWEQNRGSLEEAQADMESIRIRLDKTKVRAPFDGQAGLRNFSVGDYVQVGQSLTTVDAVNPMKITFSVAEKNYSDLKPGQKVSFFVDAWPGESFSGEVYAVSPRVDEATRNFDVKASIPNPDGRLRPGMFARLEIVTAVHTGALTVPEQAIIPQGDDSFVFAVREGKAVMQKVGIGLRQPGIVEITSGLAAGEPVVTAGVMKIQDGMPVMVMGQKPADPAVGKAP
jgi:membrane fusion protein (multidrug efflux system)